MPVARCTQLCSVFTANSPSRRPSGVTAGTNPNMPAMTNTTPYTIAIFFSMLSSVWLSTGAPLRYVPSESGSGGPVHPSAGARAVSYPDP
jgi:hypothetical protein